LCSLVAVLACGRPDSGPRRSGPLGPHRAAVAWLGELAVTAEELDDRVLALPAQQRPAVGADLEEWFRQQAREALIERILLAEAEANGVVETDEFRAAFEVAQTRIAQQLCVTRLPAWPSTRPAEAELRAEFDRVRSALAVPEQRLLSNIFLSMDDPSQSPTVAEQASELRLRVLRGEAFSELARRHSSSESRHRGGEVGWVQLGGTLEPVLEKVVFSLEEGVPSEPVATRSGWHLFQVDQILPARNPTFEEAREHLADQLLARGRQSVVADLLRELVPPPGSMRLQGDALRDALRGGQLETVVIRFGAGERTVADLRRQHQLVAQRLASEAGRPPAPTEVLEQMWNDELLNSHCAQPAVRQEFEAELQTRLDGWQSTALLAQQRRQRLQALAAADEVRLRAFYDSNVDRFMTPVRWTLRRIQLPLDSSAAQNMARWESLARSGNESPDEIARRFGGTLDDLGPATIAELRVVHPTLPALVAPLEIGQYAPPYRTRSNLQLVQLVGREAAVPRPFDEVRDQAAAAYAEQYRHDLYEELAEQLAPLAQVQYDEDALALLGRQVGADDITVDELEELFEQFEGP
jgi:peptidylprolyl isomerase